MSSKVYVKGPNGVKYEYLNTSTWNSATRKTEHKQVSTGMHIDPQSGELVPNRKKGDAARKHEEAADAAKEEEILRRGVLVESTGEALLLDHIAAGTRLEEALKTVFPDDWAMILSCAYYLACNANALCLLQPWAEDRRLPYDKPLSSQRISELLKRIPESRTNEFFKERARLSLDKTSGCYALDITSISSYSRLIEHVERGYNRDHERLPQINMLMVMERETRLPLCYRLLSGSMPDVSALRATLRSMELLRCEKLHLLLDRAFCSYPNLEDLYKYHMKFTMAMPFSLGLAQERIEKHREHIDDQRNVCMDGDSVVFGVTDVVSWRHHRLYVHVFWNKMRAVEEEMGFLSTLEQCGQELRSGERRKEHENMYEKYFIVKKTPKRGLGVRRNEAAVEECRASRAGWFIIVSNVVRTAQEALGTCRTRDVVEKGFEDIKNDLDLRRLRIHSSDAMHGRVFIQFVALVLESRLRCLLEGSRELSSLSLHEVTRAMSTFKETTFVGHKTSVPSEATKRQKQIAACCGFSLPRIPK